jgi:pimeloyl-ACP methyl ester carboxylesterase
VQVRRFQRDDALAVTVLDRVREMLPQHPRVLIGHSLGSIVAYETLCQIPDHGITTLITVGSPPIGNNGTLTGDSEREGGQMTPATVPMHPPQARSVRAVTDRLLRAGYRLVGPTLRGMPVEFLTDDEAVIWTLMV